MGNYRIPKPVNEPIKSYAPGTPERAALKARLTKLWDYERYGVPSREGPWYIFSRNTGLQKQAVVYNAKALDAAPEVLIDPNTLSKDGTVALASTSFSDDRSRPAIIVSASLRTTTAGRCGRRMSWRRAGRSRRSWRR